MVAQLMTITFHWISTPLSTGIYVMFCCMYLEHYREIFTELVKKKNIINYFVFEMYLLFLWIFILY